MRIVLFHNASMVEAEFNDPNPPNSITIFETVAHFSARRRSSVSTKGNRSSGIIESWLMFFDDRCYNALKILNESGTQVFPLLP
jgi:hypothetical protein